MFDANQTDTRYAKSGELNIAYQVFGTGDVNLVFIPGWHRTSRTSGRCANLPPSPTSWHGLRA
jgi:hypothetical protein